MKRRRKEMMGSFGAGDWLGFDSSQQMLGRNRMEHEPFAEYVWMQEEGDSFDQKVIAELVEEEQMDEFFEEMLEEEEYHFFNSLQLTPSPSPEQIPLPPMQNLNIDRGHQSILPDDSDIGAGDSGDGEDSGLGIDADVPWSNGAADTCDNEIETDSDSSEGGGPQR